MFKFNPTKNLLAQYDSLEAIIYNVNVKYVTTNGAWLGETGQYNKSINNYQLTSYILLVGYFVFIIFWSYRIYNYT